MLRLRALRLCFLALAVTIGLVAIPRGDEPVRDVPSSVLTDYFAARGQSYCWGDCPANAQRVCLAGDCPCFDEPYQTQCFAERKTSFVRDNPPRGELTGVCWAALGKWERDAQSGQNVYRSKSAIYSRVRFNEAQTLSKWARDDRDASFEVEVGEAWNQFVQTNYVTEFPAADGWNWSMRCVSTDHPRKTEDQEWARAQEQATYQRVFMPRFGVADTPEERALEAKLAKERAAKAAEEKRIADAKAAEAARIKAAAEARRRAEVAAMEAQLGAGKRASAERLLAMNEEVAKYRPKVPLAVMPKPTATPSAAPTAKGAPPGDKARTITQYVWCYGRLQPLGKHGDEYYSNIQKVTITSEQSYRRYLLDGVTANWRDYLVGVAGLSASRDYYYCRQYETQAEAERWLANERTSWGRYSALHHQSYYPTY